MGLGCLYSNLCIAPVCARQTLLESNTVGDLSCEFWEARKPVAAICHGVLALSRAACDEGVSPLTDTVTTTVPQFMESQAYLITR
jgi:putative intracellular protease/amidase